MFCSHVRKIKALKLILDLKLRKNQNGFRTKRTTVSQILAIRRIIKGVKNHNKPAVITFSDFKTLLTQFTEAK